VFYHGESQSLTVPNKSKLPAMIGGEGFCSGLELFEPQAMLIVQNCLFYGKI